jgi:hypothetical protein
MKHPSARTSGRRNLEREEVEAENAEVVAENAEVEEKAAEVVAENAEVGERAADKYFKIMI